MIIFVGGLPVHNPNLLRRYSHGYSGYAINHLELAQNYSWMIILLDLISLCKPTSTNPMKLG